MVLTAASKTTSSQKADDDKIAQRNGSANTPPAIRQVPLTDVDYEYVPPAYYEHLDGKFGWFARGDFEPSEERVPFNKPKLRQVNVCLLCSFVLKFEIDQLNLFCRMKYFI